MINILPHFLLIVWHKYTIQKALDFTIHEQAYMHMQNTLVNVHLIQNQPSRLLK